MVEAVRATHLRRDKRCKVFTVDMGPSALDAAEHFHELGHLPALFIPVARGDGTLDAMRDMVLQEQLLHTLEGCARGGNLGHNIDTISVGLDHPGKPPYLPLDAAEAFEAGLLGLLTHPA